MLKTYLTKLHDIAMRGDAREESFYAPLSELLAEYARQAKLNKIHITTLPKQTEAGNPDFRVWDGKQHIVGYIEAKEPNVEYLDRVETSVQLKRYRHTFPNLLLTNFFEFRLYRNGALTTGSPSADRSGSPESRQFPPPKMKSSFWTSWRNTSPSPSQRCMTPRALRSSLPSGPAS